MSWDDITSKGDLMAQVGSRRDSKLLPLFEVKVDLTRSISEVSLSVQQSNHQTHSLFCCISYVHHPITKFEKGSYRTRAGLV